MDGKGTRLHVLLQARGGREEIRGKKKKNQVSYVKHKDWNLVILIVFPARKAVPRLWGKV